MIKMLTASLLLSTLSTVAAGAVTADPEFASKATMGGNAEIAAGKLAEQNGSAKTKMLGARMVKEHTAAGQTLATILKAEGMTPTTSRGADGRAELAKLSALHGAAFDSAYISAQIKDHQAVLALLDREIAHGQDKDLVGWAKAARPTVAEHLKMFENAR